MPLDAILVTNAHHLYAVPVAAARVQLPDHITRLRATLPTRCRTRLLHIAGYARCPDLFRILIPGRALHAAVLRFTLQLVRVGRLPLCRCPHVAGLQLALWMRATSWIAVLAGLCYTVTRIPLLGYPHLDGYRCTPHAYLVRLAFSCRYCCGLRTQLPVGTVITPLPRVVRSYYTHACGSDLPQLPFYCALR